MQLYILQHDVSLIRREEDRPDIFSWPSDALGAYMPKLAYKRLSLGLTYFESANLIWKY